MATMSELYQSVILDHNRSPRNYRAMENAHRHAEGYNPLCGDQLGVWLKLGDGEVIVDQLAKVGVKVKIEQIEWGQWLSRVWKEADYDLTIIGHAEAWDVANYANPKYYYRYDSAKFQELFKQSEVTLDDKARREQYAQLQKMQVEDAPVVFLFIHPRLVAAKRGVTGIWKDLPIPSADLSEVGWSTPR